MQTGHDALHMGFTDEEATQLDAIAVQMANVGMGYRPEVLGQVCLPVMLGNPGTIQRYSLDMKIKAADVHKAIEEMEIYSDTGRTPLK